MHKFKNILVHKKCIYGALFPSRYRKSTLVDTVSAYTREKLEREDEVVDIIFTVCLGTNAEKAVHNEGKMILLPTFMIIDSTVQIKI